MVIGERIKARRTQLGLSQADLGKACGVSRNAVSMWESSESKGLKPDNLIRCADALETTPRWLALGGDERIIDLHKSLDRDALDVAVRFSRLDANQKNAMMGILESYEQVKRAARAKRTPRGQTNEAQSVRSGRRTTS